MEILEIDDCNAPIIEYSAKSAFDITTHCHESPYVFERVRVPELEVRFGLKSPLPYHCVDILPYQDRQNGGRDG
jgi:hypothetical protein